MHRLVLLGLLYPTTAVLESNGETIDDVQLSFSKPVSGTFFMNPNSVPRLVQMLITRLSK